MFKRFCNLLYISSGNYIKFQIGNSLITEVGFRGLSLNIRSPLRSHRFCTFTYPVIMKVDSPEFKSILTPEVKTLVGIFEKYNYEIRVAGGAVRDILLSQIPKDVDFATTATPQQMKEMFNTEGVRMINMKGEKHGTITAHINGENFEVTTLRIDVATDGRHAEVEFTTDWKLDAGRRDLTVNSMFMGMDGTVFDYFGGHEDLKKKRLAFVGDARGRIKEDYLRILRYFRFYGRIATSVDDHDEDTLKAIEENAEGLKNISGERIYTELYKILSGKFVGHLVTLMVDLGITKYMGLPERPNTKELVSVWERGKELGLQPATLVAALLASTEEVMDFHRRCKLSTFDKNLALFVVSHRDAPPPDNPLRSYQTLTFSSEGKLSDNRTYIIQVLRYRADIDLLGQYESWEPPKFPLSGHRLRELKVPPGKTMGVVMGMAKAYWMEHDFAPTEDELAAQVPTFLDQLTHKTKS